MVTFWQLLRSLFIVVLVCSEWTMSQESQDVYQIGVGISDITGPAAQVNLMGYAMLNQVAAGIHLRQWSRAFIFGDGTKRIVFVNIEAGMVSQAVKTAVSEALTEKYGDLYSAENVLITGTHTHSGPGGFFQYFLYDITSYGFVKETFDALVDGIMASIDKAHNSMKSGRIYYNTGELTDASANRSPFSYLNNPEEERKNYEFDTDKTMFLLKLVDLNNNPIGMINWFAVHGTSMNNSNGLISSDNKGYASLLFEQAHNPPNTFPGQGAFVAAFAQSNEGDSSPNTKGAKCIDTGLPCDNLTSTCNGKNSLCIAFGPGSNMFESTKIIGQKQFDKANELFQTAINPINGPVQFIHQHIQMSDRQLIVDGESVSTCKASLGFSFAAGTTDGPGLDGFHQGTTQGLETGLMRTLSNILGAPSLDLTGCQSPKPVLLPTGELNLPYEWTPDILPTQIIRLGNLVILAVPGEFTTMSGRRLRDAVHSVLDQTDINQNGDMQVVIAGLANVYSNYIATYEEYQIQRYEGASTMFGPHTLSAYIDQYKFLAINLANESPVESGPDPPNLMDVQISLLPDVVYETVPFGRKFGDVLVDANSEYTRGSIASVSFLCGNPRNNLLTGSTFLAVEYRDLSTGKWTVVAKDSQWETRFYWKESNELFHESQCTVQWEIPASAVIGDYRIRHVGYHKDMITGIVPYVGLSRVFKVKATSSTAAAKKPVNPLHISIG